MTDVAPISPVVAPPKPLADDADVAWHKQACAEAINDTNAALLTKTAAENPGSHAMKAVVVRSDRLWANGTVLTCGFMDKAPLTTVQTNQQAKVRKTVLEWQKYANITFNFVDDIASATVRITFDPNSGSWSFVGKEVSTIKSDQPTMNLGWIDGTNDVVSPTENGVILHEFGHTLGLMHEHQSPARGNKITLKEDAVIKFYTSTQGWTADEVKAQIIDVYNTQDVSNYSDVDLTSVMQYFMPPELNVQGIRVDPNNKLSEIDKAFMLINYPFPDLAPGQPGPKRAQFVAALDTVGVVGDEKDTILKLYDAQNWPEVRYEFTRFCTDMRVARKAAEEPPAGPSHGVAPPEVIPDGCLAEDDDPATAGTGAAKAVATGDAELWLPGDTITYSYVQGSLDATEYRKRRISETFAFYSSRVNIKFEEIPFEPKTLSAKMHIYFGDIPKPGVAGWCKIGKLSIGFRQTQAMIKAKGGTVESSFVISNLAVPKVEPTDDASIRQDMRTLFHEIGHALGLKHEHVSPNTMTTDTPDANVSAATIFDDTSVMLYAGRQLRASSAWSSLKADFDPGLTTYNHIPSKLDVAFLGALYPNRKGHVDDHLEANLTTLGLKSSLTALTDLRDAAFAIEGHADFPDSIKTYRQALAAKLSALVPARTVAPPAAPSRAVEVPPSNFKAARDAAIAPPSQATTGSFLDELVKTLQAFFQPTTGQLFSLQFPGRFLQQDLYAWDTNTAGIYGQFVKPTVVNESEFRLVDQLYNVGSVVGAPNGINLSIVYEQCLNNLVPGVQQSAINFSKQQGQIRQWLLKPVPTSGWVKDLISSQHSQATNGASTSSGGPAGASHSINASTAIDSSAKPQFAVADRLSGDNSVNRMELADALMQEYLAAKQAWELERDDMIKNADTKDLDALTRKLAHITAIREAQLASKHADAVVRGYSHAIRQYLGFLDVKTPAEMLQDAKDAFRESAVSSLDGSMKIYPVQMSPIDWFQSLSTSFTMEDLTVNADVIAQQIDIKSKQLDALNTRLAIIQSKPKTDLAALQDKLNTAQTAYDNAQADLASTYTSNVLSLAKTFVDASGKFQLEDFKAGAAAAKIADSAFANIQAGMDKLSSAQLSVTQTSRALTLLMSQKSLAEASDTTQEVIETNVQITALTKDIQELTTRLQTLRYSPSTDPPADPTKAPSVNDVDLHPPTSSSGGSRWQDIYMKHVVDNKYTASSDESQATTSKTDVSLFFGSYHSENSQSSATSSSVTANQSVEVEVGFRATMVTVDRGGWFQPQFFKQSAAFHSIDPAITWSKWPTNIKTLKDLTTDDGKSFTELNGHLLPAYPVGFVVCKDITIRIHMSTTDIQSAGAEMEKFAASSAGILCWSTSSSEHSKSSDKSYSFVQKSDGCIIRIPGPQILGYMMQFTENDESTPIPDKLPDGFLLSDADYDASFNAPPARAVDPSTAPPQTTPPPTK